MAIVRDRPEKGLRLMVLSEISLVQKVTTILPLACPLSSKRCAAWI